VTVKDGKVRKTFSLSEKALSVLDDVLSEDRSDFVSDAVLFYAHHNSGGKLNNSGVSEDVSDPVGFELARMNSVLSKLDSLDFSSYASWVSFFNDPDLKEYSFLEESFAGFVSGDIQKKLLETYPINTSLKTFILAEALGRVSGLVDERSSGGSSSDSFRLPLRLKDFLSDVIRVRVGYRAEDLLFLKEHGLSKSAYLSQQREKEDALRRKAEQDAERERQERIEAERVARKMEADKLKAEEERIKKNREEAERERQERIEAKLEADRKWERDHPIRSFVGEYYGGIFYFGLFIFVVWFLFYYGLLNDL
jgi:hypothetical protein